MSHTQISVGMRFGRWLVKSPAGRERRSRLWLCECDCGTRRSVRGDNLLRGMSQSCGCWPGELGRLAAREARR